MWKTLKNKLRPHKGLIISLFIAFIMIFSAFGVIFYGFTESSNSLDYNGYTFTQVQTGFATSVAGKQYVFSNLPGDVEFLNVSSSVINQVKAAKMVYLTYDPNASDVQSIAAAQFQFQQDLGNLDIYAAPAFTKTNTYKLPVVTCANVTQYVPVVDFEYSNVTEIQDINGCLKMLAAYPEDFMKMKDRLLFGILGVIK